MISEISISVKKQKFQVLLFFICFFTLRITIANKSFTTIIQRNKKLINLIYMYHLILSTIENFLKQIDIFSLFEFLLFMFLLIKRNGNGKYLIIVKFKSTGLGSYHEMNFLSEQTHTISWHSKKTGFIVPLRHNIYFIKHH